MKASRISHILYRSYYFLFLKIENWKYIQMDAISQPY